MSKANQIQHLLEQQGELSELISNSFAKLKSSSNITSHRIESRIKALSNNWNDYKNNHNSLGILRSSVKSEQKAEYDEDPYFKGKAFMECEENYLDAMEQMAILLEQITPKSSMDGKALSDYSIVRESSSSTTHVRLPVMDLPIFSGEFSDWAPFKDAFTSQIGAHTSLTCVEKLQYLKACLAGGKAASRLHTMPLTAANFKVAWDDLLEHYDNKRLLADSALDLLFSAKSVTQESAEHLDSLLNTINQAVGSLEGLGSKVDQWDEILVFLVSRKLDSASIKEWEKHLGSKTETSTWKEFKEFLQTRIRSLQAFERVNPKQQDIRKSSSIVKNQLSKARSHHVAVRNSSQLCSLCNGNHFISTCPSYLSKSFEERHQFVTQKKLCFNCLGPHSISRCYSKKRCNICFGRHHTSIHPGGNASNQQSTSLAQNSSTIESVSIRPSVSTASVNATYIYKSPRSGILLATALVKIKSCNGTRHVVRAFLDQGSEINLISEKLSQILGLPRVHTSLSIAGIGADTLSSRRANGKVTLDIQSCVNEYKTVFDAFILPKLTSYLPSTMVAINNWPHLKGLQLADPEYHQPGRIDLILGVEVYSQIIQNGLRKGSSEAPIAQLTSLGWILSGSVQSAAHTPSVEAEVFHCHIDHEINDLIKRFWIQEEVFSSPSNQLTSEEEQCEEIFNTTHSRNSEGRYIVRLPFKSRPVSLGDSRTAAVNMIHRMQKRFMLNSTFYEDYSKFIREYEDLGHMRRTSAPPKVADQVFYLPHHGVVRDMSSTTKLRVVFNGSCKTQQGLSLNEFLHEGPKLHVDLPDVITRWRMNQFAFSSDVTKMFRQIQVHPDDWDFQRILWLENSNLVEFVLTTVTYGTSSAPYLANRVLRQLAADEGRLYPEAKEVIEQNTYVDDVYSGASSILKGKHKISQIINHFKAGGFPLQKWAASHESLLEDVPIQERASCTSSQTHSIKGGPIHRTLGLNWQPAEDRFIFTSEQFSEPDVYTKRNVLSRIAKLFDPLGWLSPVVIRGKIFMQELWEANLSWDEAIPLNLVLRWKTYIHELQDLHLISVPRWLGLTSSYLSVEIHGFADASHSALGAVIYLRVVRGIDNIQTTILASKTKVAPIQKTNKSSNPPRNGRVTTPRLELSAALLLTRHVNYIRKVLNLEVSAIHLWTDSSTALFWIQGQPTRWKDFVRNRVSQIQEILPEAHWHHIPGENNPADHASRGLSPRQLSEKSLWWFGPSWLQLDSSLWPSLCLNLDTSTDLEERRPIVAFTTTQKSNTSWDLINKYSSLIRLLRITAWCRRLIPFSKTLKQKAKSDGNVPPKITKFSRWLKPEELDEAKVFWIKYVQIESFSSEIRNLSSLQSIHRSSPIYRLTPFIDCYGILRIGGRLRNAQIDPDTKHPIIHVSQT